MCDCKRESHSSKVQVALCSVAAEPSPLECSVEWPVLFLTVARTQFDSSLLIRCQRIRRLLLTAESRLAVLRPDMFLHSSNLETLVVKAPVRTLENVLLRHLTSLRKLDISETPLDSIPSAIFEECPVSEILRLVANRIAQVDDKAFKNCIYLLRLDLSGNLLTRVGLRTFEGAFNLEVLDLSRNKIKDVDDLSFQSLKKLKVLSLHGNLLQAVKRHTLADLSTLTHLRLDSNRISYLAVDCFRGLTSIQVINLRDNKVANLDLILFLNLRHLKLSFPDVECVQERDEDRGSVNLALLKDFEKYPLCHGFKRPLPEKDKASGIQKLVQPHSLAEKRRSESTSSPKEKDYIVRVIEGHPYLVPMVLGGLAVTLVSIIVVAVVCHVKNKRINELKLQELQMPMMQSTL